MWNRRIAIIVIVAACIRFFLVFTAAGTNSDAFKYALTTRQMRQHGLVAGMRGDYFWPYFPVNRQLILYPFLGSLVDRVVGDEILSLRIVTALSGVALVWVAYLVAIELFRKEEIGLLAAGLMAFHSEFTMASAAVYRETTMALLLTLALLLFLWSVRGKRPWPLWALATGLVLFGAFVTRADGVAAAVALGLIALFVAPGLPWKRRIAVCALMGVVFVALEVPYVLWMKKETGYWLVNQWQIQSKLSPEQSARRFLLGDEEH